MIKLNILNLEDFLNVLNNCSGSVRMIRPDGTNEDICRNRNAQVRLEDRFRAAGGRIPLSLTFTDPKDYFKIVNYYISEG